MRKHLFLLFLLLIAVTACGKAGDWEIIFDSNGGSEIATITKPEDFNPESLPIPKKPGYAFAGWYLDISLSEKLTAKNLPESRKFTLYAKWTVISVPYRIEHYWENPDDDGYTLHETENLTGEIGAAISASPRSYSGFEEHTTHPGRVQTGTVKEDGTAVLKLYYRRLTFTVSCDPLYGSDPVTVTKKYGASLTTPDTPARQGYDLVRWYETDETVAYSFVTMPDHDLSLHALWEKHTFRVQFSCQGADVPDAFAIYQEAITEPVVPIRPGYRFLGWYQEADYQNLYVFSSSVNADLTLYGKWEAEVVHYDVEHYQENANDDGYTLSDSETLLARTDTFVYASGKSYSGFTENQSHEARISEGTVKGDGSLVLKLYYSRNRHQIVFDAQGGSDTASLTVRYGETVTLPAPTKKGHDFLYWYEGEDSNEAIALNSMPDRDLSVAAKWLRLSYTIHFDCNAQISVTEIKALYDEVIQAPSAPILNGHTFLGWYTDPALTNLYQFSRMPDSSFTLYAKWEGEPAVIVFNSVGGTPADSVTLPVGSPIVPPETEKVGYELAGWYDDNTYTTLFDWYMPAGGITVFAKWTPKTYTITFNTLGGSSIAPLSQAYLSAVSAPADPVKPEYAFAGWYTDPECTSIYEFSVMPLNGITLYAKWVDPADMTTISFVLLQDFGDPVSVRDTVFARRTDLYRGFYISDDTGYLFILSDAAVTEGDTVLVTGNLEPTPMINGISSIVIESSGNAIRDPEMLSLAQIEEVTPNLSAYSRYIRTCGVIASEGDRYYIDDPATGIRLPIDHRFYRGSSDSLAGFNGEYAQIDAILSAYDTCWEIGFLDVHQLITDAATKVEVLKQTINKQYADITVRPLSPFVFTDNVYGWGTVSFTPTGENSSLYNSSSETFGNTDTEKTVDFAVTITVGAVSDSMIISILVKPIEVMTISQFLQSGAMDRYTIQGIVSMKTDFGLYVLRDDTASVFVYAPMSTGFDLGSEIILTGSRSFSGSSAYMDGYHQPVILEGVVQKNLDPCPEPVLLSETEILNQMTHRTIAEGTYVEVRGFLRADEYYLDSYYLDINGDRMDLLPTGFSSADGLREYRDYEVVVKGFLYEEYEGNLALYFTGNRGSIKPVQGNDTETINRIQAMFISEYDEAFHPGDEFRPHAQDYYSGALITWTMPESSLTYFDMETKTFRFTETAHQISIDMTITLNAVVFSFRINTMLEPLPYVTASEFQKLPDGEEVYVKGLVVYRHPNYFYLLTDSGLIYADLSYLDVYKGDYVVLHGEKRFEGYREKQESYLYYLYDSDYRPLNPLVKIISRDNPVSIPTETLSLYEIVELDPTDTTVYTKHIETTGYLTVDEYLYLVRGETRIRIQVVDEYMEAQLLTHLHQTVTLKGYLSGYDEGSFVIRYTGMEQALTEVTYDDLATFDAIKEDLLAIYGSRHYTAYDRLNLLSMHPQYGSMISYEAFGENAAYIDITTGNISDVDAITPVDMIAQVTIGESHFSFSFAILLYPQDHVISLETITIEEALALNDGDFVTIKGIVLTTTNYQSDTLVLIEDETGRMYVQVPWVYGTTLLGKEIRVSGTIIEYRGRKELGPDSQYTISTSATSDDPYDPMTLPALVSADHRDESVIGQSVSLSGTVTSDRYGNFYLTDGYDKVALIGYYDVIWALSRNIGYSVTVKGHIYGYEPGNKDVFTVIVHPNTDFSVITAEYTDSEIVGFASAQVIALYQGTIYEPYSTEYFIRSIAAFPVQITYTVKSGAEYVTLFDNEVLFHHTSLDTPIVFEFTVTSNAYSETYEFTVYLRGYILNDFEDLLRQDLGAPGVYLEGTLLYSGQGFYYFMIGDQIYYLEGYFNTGLNEGDQVLLLGRKSVVDGRSDYTYEIRLLYIESSDPIELMSEEMSMEFIYESDPEYLSRRLLQVQGILQYDEDLKMPYLEDGSYKLYIRMNAYIPTIAFRDSDPVYDYLKELIGELVSMRLLFPNKKILGNVYLTDFRNQDGDLMPVELSPEEEVMVAIRKLKATYDMKVMTPGQNFWFDDDYMHNTSFMYTLADSSNEAYFDWEKSLILPVDTGREVVMNFTATHESGMYTTTFTMTLILEPLALSTVREVLWGVTGDLYRVRGIVQTAGDDQFLILKDNTGMIYVECSYFSDFSITLIAGDEVEILGYRLFYQSNDFVPILDSVLSLKILSRGNSVFYVSVPMSHGEILRLDYLCPDTFNHYIAITGRVVAKGSEWYPYFLLVNDDLGDVYGVEMIGTDYEAFNTLMQSLNGETITVYGYLIGYQYIYDPFDWYLIYQTHSN